MMMTRTRLFMIIAAGMAGGLFALISAVGSVSARVVVATLGGVCVGLALYFHGELHRMPP